MGLPASYRVSRVRYYSGAAPALATFRLREFHPLCPYLPVCSARYLKSFTRSSTPNPKEFGLGFFPFARRYLGNRSFFLFLRVLRCFSSPRSLLYAYVFSAGYRPITTGGFPHSDICGSPDICSSPQLFAACHVLLRRPVPRHPPCALSCLTFLLIHSVNRLLFWFLSVQNHSSHLFAVLPDLLLGFRCRFRFRFSSFLIQFSGYEVLFLTLSYELLRSLLNVLRVRVSSRSLRFAENSRANSVLQIAPLFGQSVVVENKGFEPLTPCVQGRCSPN